MIRIHKSAAIPAVLENEGKAHLQAICKMMEDAPDAYQSGPGKRSKDIGRLPIDKEIYGHASVKQQLIKDQLEKCCFCESKFLATSAGDVEHFRPKGAVLINGEKTLTFPGYYWLAYHWDNLLLSCENCNRRFKRNYFPLEDEGKRILHHQQHAEIGHEIPVLVNPIVEDPEEHITFEAEVALPKNDSHRGQESIRCFGLNRSLLCDDRARYLELLQPMWEASTADEIPEQLRDRFMDLMRKAILPNSEFAAMIRANFPTLRQA